MKDNFTTEPTVVKRKAITYNEQLFINIYEIDKFLERHSLSSLIKEERDNQNSSMHTNKINL